MALKLRNQWLSLSGVVALKFRTSGSERAGIIMLYVLAGIAILSAGAGAAYVYRRKRLTTER